MTFLLTPTAQLNCSGYRKNSARVLRPAYSKAARPVQQRKLAAGLRPIIKVIFILIVAGLAVLWSFLPTALTAAASPNDHKTGNLDLQLKSGNYSSLELGPWIGWRALRSRETARLEQTKLPAESSSPLSWIRRHRGPFFSTRELKLSKIFPLNLRDSSPQNVEEKMPGPVKTQTKLARVTVYWPGEGNDYTKRGLSSTGVKLRDGHCAVDPKVIPYGSVVKLSGIGKYVAVDTGPAVVSRRAARASGRTSAERNALVIDVYCSSRSKAKKLEKSAAKFALVTWYR
jgi:3D (Asp-Asp-Asp) domain-containing protein